MGGGRGAADRRMHRSLDPAFGAAAGRLARPLYRAERRHTRSVEGGRLPLRDGLGDGRSADLDAHPRSGPILSVPYPLEINDSPALVFRRHTGRQFAEMVIDQFDEMLDQSRNTRWSLPSRRIPLSSASRSACALSAMRFAISSNTATDLWITTPGEIARYCESLPKGTIPGSQ